ncbi:MAG: hypothetical protein H7A00_08430 [Hahellaceae bacterium]|nr:hypothetical protein [Hahellaceae bacterium]
MNRLNASPSLTNLKAVRICATMALAGTLLLSGGCASIMDAGLSQAEVPTLENNLNRTVIGLGLVRAMNTMASMPISADATWPKQLSESITTENRQRIDQFLERDPFVATHDYTVQVQEQQLGGYAFATPKTSPILYHAMNKVNILYGDDVSHWPDFFALDSDFSSYGKFKDGQPKQVEALTGNVYENIGVAVISLMPVNYQKDLDEYRRELNSALEDVGQLKAREGELKTYLETKKDNVGNPLDDASLAELSSEKAALEVQISEHERLAEEKQTIYLSQLDEAVEVLKADIRLDDEQILLAKNIALATDAIGTGAYEAGTAFTIALTNIGLKGCLQNFDKELQSLAIGKVLVPGDKQDLYNRRLERLTNNAIYVLPAIGIGSYYAIKQSLLAGKYESVAEVVLEADESRKALEAAQNAQAAQATNAQ